ncbi:hypothetical protein [Pseudoalteromonas rubra]|uniref:Fibronectin type-III domain-containing protein n=1 Tax=Pseudoalteromonas rubra TaxID=43658 RepID=A0A4Q7E5P5_9GAMM|nr:hypothetical protein [Pseudoalteromonas rubra]RZM78362.1 hypothetical protein C3B51_14380 [Pseudoalteromonas rubra]
MSNSVRLAALLFVFFHSISNSYARDFEQAYILVSVGKIQVPIPVTILPASSKLVTLRETESGYELEWSPIDSTEFYIVEQLVNGHWQQVGGDITATRLTVTNKLGSNFRVTACGRYGCGSAAIRNSIVDGPVAVKRFSSSSDQVLQGEQTTLSWHTSNASNVYITTNFGQVYRGLPAVGSMRVSPHDFGIYTLNANGFGSSVSVSATVVVEKPRALVSTPQTAYLEPLRNKGFDVIGRTLLELPLGVVFSTHDEHVALVNKSGDIVWRREVDGVVANQGHFNVSDGVLSFSVSKLDGTGRLCSLDVNTGNNFKCIATESPAIAKPFMLDVASSSFASRENQSAASGTEPTQKVIAVVDMNGRLYLADKDTLNVKHSALLPAEVRQQKITANIAAEYGTSRFVMRVSNNQYAALSINPPDDGCHNLSTCTRSVMSVFGMEDDEPAEPVIKLEWFKEVAR